MIGCEPQPPRRATVKYWQIRLAASKLNGLGF
jgi:hypothetical protein